MGTDDVRVTSCISLIIHEFNTFPLIARIPLFTKQKEMTTPYLGNVSIQIPKIKKSGLGPTENKELTSLVNTI